VAEFKRLARIGPLAVAVTVTMAGCHAGSRTRGHGNGNANANGANVVDRSDFREFRFTQGRALGFCPDLDSVYEASIDLQDDGTYTLEMSIIEEGEQEVDACMDNADLVDVEADCVVVRELPSRSLTAAEAQHVREVFSTIGSEYYSFDEDTCIDPCLVYWLRWDDFATTPDLAGCLSGTVERLDRSDFAEIRALLEDLRTVD
jgi:hypothetical protein